MHVRPIPGPIPTLPHTLQWFGRTSALALALMLAPLAAANAEEPVSLIRDTTQTMLSELKANKEAIRNDKDKLYDLIDRVIMPVVDFPLFARLVLGKHWRDASREQRRRFTEEFQTLMLRTYTGSIVDHLDVRFEYQGQREGSRPDRTTVRTELHFDGEGSPVGVDYRLYERSGDWRIYDVVIDGVSTVATFRSSFSAEIERLGLNGFLQDLVEKNQQGETLEQEA